MPRMKLLGLFSCPITNGCYSQDQAGGKVSGCMKGGKDGTLKEGALEQQWQVGESYAERGKKKKRRSNSVGY